MTALDQRQAAARFEVLAPVDAVGYVMPSPDTGWTGWWLREGDEPGDPHAAVLPTYERDGARYADVPATTPAPLAQVMAVQSELEQLHQRHTELVDALRAVRAVLGAVADPT
jgi:hypothetical protein